MAGLIPSTRAAEHAVGESIEDFWPDMPPMRAACESVRPAHDRMDDYLADPAALDALSERIARSQPLRERLHAHEVTPADRLHDTSREARRPVGAATPGEGVDALEALNERASPAIPGSPQTPDEHGNGTLDEESAEHQVIFFVPSRLSFVMKR